MVIDVGLLNSKPNASVVNEVLEALDGRDQALSLVEILTIVKMVVPIYPSLKPGSKLVLLNLIAKNFNFMAQLVSFTSSLPEKQAEKRIYKSLLSDLITKNNQCLLNYLEQCTASKILGDDLKTLLFGSKLFNVISTEMDIIEYLRRLREQWRYAFAKMPTDILIQRANQVGKLLIAMLTLHPVLTRVVIVEEFFLAAEDQFQSLKLVTINSTVLNRQKLLKNLIIPYLDLHTNAGNCQSIYSILRELGLNDFSDASYILRLSSPLLKECIIKLVPSSSLHLLLRLLLQKFAKVDLVEDEIVCQMIVMIIKYSQSSDLKSQVGTDSKFLDGVTTRLMHKDHLVRERTMFVAKVVSNGDLKYDSDFVIEVSDFKPPDNSQAIDFNSLSGTISPEVPTRSIQKVSDTSFSVDSDDDDDNDDEETGREIVFLKDLVVEYASLDKKGTSLLSLLKLTVKLLRQKKDFPSEVSYYSTGLLSSIACLNNNLDEPNFEQGRINALVSILVVTPDKVTELLRILFTSELSLQQKMSILSGFGLAARELRGFNDASIAKPQYDFPTSRLPWDKKQDRLIEDVRPTNEQDMAPQKVVWKSKKLTTSFKDQPVKNKFRQYAGQFFYPLAHAWIEGINLGTFDELFKSHYLMTLHIIYRCADPVYDYDSMTELMREIMMDATQQGIKI